MIYAIQNQIQEQLNGVSNSLRAFSLKLTGNNDDAEDLYQDTALRIITNAEKYNPGTNFKAWAVTIMRNIFINNYRKKVRRNLIIDQTPNNYFINSGDKAVENNGETQVSYDELSSYQPSKRDSISPNTSSLLKKLCQTLSRCGGRKTVTTSRVAE